MRFRVYHITFRLEFSVPEEQAETHPTKQQLIEKLFGQKNPEVVKSEVVFERYERYE